MIKKLYDFAAVLAIACTLPACPAQVNISFSEFGQTRLSRVVSKPRSRITRQSAGSDWGLVMMERMIRRFKTEIFRNQELWEKQ